MNPPRAANAPSAIEPARTGESLMVGQYGIAPAAFPAPTARSSNGT